MKFYNLGNKTFDTDLSSSALSQNIKACFIAIDDYSSACPANCSDPKININCHFQSFAHPLWASNTLTLKIIRTVEKNPTYCSRSASNEMLKRQELVYDNYKPFFSQSFMNVRNKACRYHSCVKVSPQENWWDGNHFKMFLSASNKMIQCNF